MEPNLGGRPLKYPNEDEITRLAEEYLSQAVPENQSLATIEGLALHLDLNDETITEYAKRYPKFSAVVKKLKTMQRADLMRTGLFGGKEVNAGMAIFLLKAIHGMKETSVSEIGGVDGKPLSVNIIGGGYVPPIRTVNAPSEGSDMGSTSVQGSHLASAGTKDNNSNNGNSAAGAH